MKICACSIAKNESRHVERWVTSLKGEVDSIIVLDTGSSDNTVELLKSYGVTTYETSYERFRWDVARNDLMKLIPKECDIVTFVDLDEMFEPGWRKVIEDNWILGKHLQAKYLHVLEHDKNNKLKLGQYNTWMIANISGWYWKYPIHEELLRDDIDQLTSDQVLDVSDKVILHHYPDKTKSRAWYNPMFEERLKEYPNQMSKYYYAKYLFDNKDYIKSTEMFVNIICEDNDHSISRYERADCAYHAALVYFRLKDYKSCENCLLRGLHIAPTFSLMSFELSKLYEFLGRIDEAKIMINHAIHNNDFGWIIYDNSLDLMTKFKSELDKTTTEEKISPV